MTIKADLAEPCWEPVHFESREGYWHNEERWPHFKTRAECAEAIAEIHRDRDPDDDYEDDPLHLVAAHCFPGPCVEIICDGCGAKFDYEGDNGMHFNPADPMPVSITECDWTISVAPSLAERHWCPDCAPPWCEDCGEQHDPDDTCAAVDRRPVPISECQLSLDGAT